MVNSTTTLLTDAQIHEVFTKFYDKTPDPQIELEYNSPYTLLVAVILSAQSTDIMVNKITSKLFCVADTPIKMIELGEEPLKEYIKMVGLYNNKAKNIIAMSKLLREKFHCEVPDNFDDLCSLPGVGIKSATVILNCVYQKALIAVDTHVFRVSNRLGLCNTKIPERTGVELEKRIQKKWLLKAHYWLVLHGRYICKARKPLCDKCFLNDLCIYYNNKLS